MSAQLVWLLVEQDGALLLVQRKRAPFREGWVLPGDAVADGETAHEALARVADEHLGVELQGEELVGTLDLSDGGVDYAVGVYRVGYEGRPRYRGSGPYAEVGWAAPDELGELDIRLPERLRSFLEGLGSRQ